jgi:hypothetical protein
MTLEFSVARGNGGPGLSVDGGASARISNSVFTNNATGIANNGIVQTRQNNTIASNTTEITGNALTPLAAQ